MQCLNFICTHILQVYNPCLMKSLNIYNFHLTRLFYKLLTTSRVIQSSVAYKWFFNIFPFVIGWVFFCIKHASTAQRDHLRKAEFLLLTRRTSRKEFENYEKAGKRLKITKQIDATMILKPLQLKGASVDRNHADNMRIRK